MVPATSSFQQRSVKRASREYFTSLVHASGYLVPRATAVVMFVAPGYRVTEVKTKIGDHVERGDVVVRVGAAAPPEKNAPADVPLKAGAAGTVLQVDAFMGMPISEKPKPLVTLAVGGEVEASVSIPGVYVPELKAGQPARLTKNREKLFLLEVSRVDDCITCLVRRLHETSF